jgi:phosphoesterase RecJ-like protein
MYKEIDKLIRESNSVTIIQAENPDGDSIGSALALEEIIENLGKKVQLYCPVLIPKYLHYIDGWDRINQTLDLKSDLIIIVDTTAEILLSKLFEVDGARHFIETRPVIVIDHHDTKPTLSFDYKLLLEDAVSTGEIIYRIADDLKWALTKNFAKNILISILSDSLGLTTRNVTDRTITAVAELNKRGAFIFDIEDKRREYMKKSQEILKYKGSLIERIEYYLSGKLAIIHIPWEEIQKYSDQYNPSVLVLDEMKLVEGVQVGVAIKTYPDGRITGKIRANVPISDQIAGFFGGGGHEYAAGFRVYEQYDKLLNELLGASNKALTEYEKDHATSL